MPADMEYYLDLGTAYGQHAINIKSKHKFCNEYERDFIRDTATCSTWRTTSSPNSLTP